MIGGGIWGGTLQNSIVADNVGGDCYAAISNVPPPQMPPPKARVTSLPRGVETVLPLMVLLLMVRLPTLRMPPPSAKTPEAAIVSRTDIADAMSKLQQNEARLEQDATVTISDETGHAAKRTAVRALPALTH
jgi:hypothetical protein